jgi:O-antigen/teichoic acid export membrane protein
LRIDTSMNGATAGAIWVGAAAPAMRARPASLRANFAWTLAGTVVYAASQWVLLVVIVRLASADAVGTFALGLAVTGPVFLLAGLHLRASQATDAARGFGFADYFAVRLAGMIAALLATAIVSLSGHDRNAALVVLAVGATKAVEGMSDVYYGLLQQNERMRPIAVSLALRGIASVVAVSAVLWAGGGLVPAIVALGICWVAVLLIHDRRAAARPSHPLVSRALRRLDRRAFRRLVATCFPLGLVMMLVSLRTNIPRYFIARSYGPAELGVFAALSSLLTAGNVVVASLGQSASPRLARHFHEGDVRAFRRLLARLLLVAAAVGSAGLAVAVTAGEPLLRLAFGTEYARRNDLLVMLMAVGLVLYASSFFGYGLTATRRFMVQLPLFTATTAVCAAASLLLVPGYGLAGAACAWGAAMLVELLATAFVLEQALRARASGARP